MNENALSNEPSNSEHFTHEVVRDEPYYTDSPMQGRSPDGVFKTGTRVSLTNMEIGAYSHVVAENGISGYLASDALKRLELDEVSDLYALNQEINTQEINRDNEADKFFTEKLHEDLHFKRADDTWVTKQNFIENLKKPDPFEKRMITNITVQQLETDHAIVTCIVIGKKHNEQNDHRYRNIRIFKRTNRKWQLQLWYNYEIIYD